MGKKNPTNKTGAGTRGLKGLTKKPQQNLKELNMRVFCKSQLII